jgi:hypothetical protein
MSAARLPDADRTQSQVQAQATFSSWWAKCSHGPGQGHVRVGDRATQGSAQLELEAAEKSPAAGFTRR